MTLTQTLDGMTQERWNRLNQEQRDALRDNSQLTPQLEGLEGWRVEVNDVTPRPDEKQPRRFIVGKSTGWRPIHLEISRSSASGGYAALSEYRTVRKIERVR